MIKNKMSDKLKKEDIILKANQYGCSSGSVVTQIVLLNEKLKNSKIHNRSNKKDFCSVRATTQTEARKRKLLRKHPGAQEKVSRIMDAIKSSGIS